VVRRLSFIPNPETTMPSLRQKKDHFYGLFYDPGRRPAQKWIPLRTKNKGVARQKLAALEKEQAMGLFDPWSDPAPEGGVTLKEAVRRFLRSRGDLRPKTVAVYREVLNRFARTLPPDLLVTHLDPKHVRAFVDRAELAEASRASYHRHLRAFTKWAVKAGLTKQDPVEKVARPKVGRKEAAYITPKEVERLVSAIEADAKLKGGLVLPGQNVWMIDLVRFAVCTGLRRGELVNLRWADLDLDSRMLTVRNRGDFKTKSGHERRVPLVSDALEVVERRAAEELDDGFVFTGASGDGLDPEYVSRRFRHFRKLAKLPDGVHFHTLRHTAASWLVMRGVPLPIVQSILGHSDIAVTQRYAHLAPAVVRNEMERAFREIEDGTGRIEEERAVYTLAA
jgi:integrase